MESADKNRASVLMPH